MKKENEFTTNTIPVSLAQIKFATANERAIIKKHLYLKHRDGQYQPVFSIGCQSFDFSYPATEKVASWYCWMLSKALISLLTEETA